MPRTQKDQPVPFKGDRSRSCVFTSFNKLNFRLEPGMTYLVYQLEMCPDTQRMHAQGYVEFQYQKSLAAIKSALGDNSIHIEARMGTPMQAAAYCKKPDTRVPGTMPLEFGTISKQGSRTDLHTMAEKIASASSLAESKSIIAETPGLYARCSRGFDRLEQRFVIARRRAYPIIYYIVGETGAGKSTWLLNNLRDEEFIVVADSEQGWFHNYQGENVVVFEEFEGKIPRGSMLTYLSCMKTDVPVKGSFVPLEATVFIFLSNRQPDECYGGDPAWLRRVCTEAAYCGPVAGAPVLPPATCERRPYVPRDPVPNAVAGP